MNKSDLIELLADKKDLTSNTASKVICTVFDSMADALASGDKIEIRGFGSFTVKGYDARTGRNPKTGKEVLINAKKRATFKVGKDLKEKVLG